MDQEAATQNKPISEQVKEEITEKDSKVLSSVKNIDLNLENILEEVNKVDSSVTNKYSRLQRLGFSKSKTVKNINSIVRDENFKDNKNDKIKQLQFYLGELKEDLDEKKFKHPYKIVEFSQLPPIMEKYGLYFGESDAYIGRVPEKAANDISNYADNSFQWIQPTNAYGSDKYNILDSIKGRNFEQKDVRSEPTFYICAPYDHFDTTPKNIRVENRLIYRSCIKSQKFSLQKPEVKFEFDPIVLSPIKVEHAGKFDLMFFHVVTAWGPEAQDPRIFKPKDN